jgi:acetyltransferase-like isoleucine patch superfamily enzyme
MSVSIPKTTHLGQHVVLQDDTILGENVTIGNNVSFYPAVIIGEGCQILDGAVLGRPPISAGNTNRPIDGRFRTLSIGPDSVIGANTVLYTGLTIGPQVLIGDLATLREDCTLAQKVVIGRGVMVMYQTTIGDRSRVIDGAILTGNMIIESDVFIGPGVNSINDNDVYLKRFGLSSFEVRGPTIRRFALIGAGANLAAGIEIGMGAIVAPQAMVTQDVPAWTVVAGVPARVVRSVDESLRAQVLAHFGIKEENP